jgi:hypothetical protein
MAVARRLPLDTGAAIVADCQIIITCRIIGTSLMANRRRAVDWIEVDVESYCNIYRHAMTDRFPPYPTCPLCNGDGWEMPIRGQTVDKAVRCRRCGGVGHLTRKMLRFSREQLERIGQLYELRRLRREGCEPDTTPSGEHKRQDNPPPHGPA